MQQHFWRYWMKYGIITSWILSIVVACSARSQPTSISPSEALNTHFFAATSGMDTSSLKNYPFIDFSNNCFRFYTSQSPNWERFFKDFNQLIQFKDRKLNVYHIGGSHLQADIYTHDIRTFLQSNWSGIPGERGHVFPFDLANTNNPWNYQFSSPNSWRSYRSVTGPIAGVQFGLMGGVVECSDSSIQIRFRHDKTTVKPGFSRVRIYHNKGYFPYELNWGPDEILIVDQFHNAKLGYTEAIFAELIDTFNLQFDRIVPEPYNLQINGFQLANTLPGISYTSIGINGAGLYTYLGNTSFEEQLKESQPHLFVFSVGTNDANVPSSSFKPEVYKQNLEAMIQKVLAANPNCAILLTVPNDAAYKRIYLNQNIEKQREVIIELAKKYQCPVWDFYSIMGGLGSSKTWLSNNLMRSDRVHFTAEGYHLKGDLFIDAFQKWLAQMNQRANKTLKTEIH